MGHQLWWKVPRMIASIDCPSPCWLGKPRNVQPDFAQLVLLFLLAWSRKERKAHEWPIPGGRTWFCFCLVRPLRSHYWLCSSLYPQGNPIHWDSRLDHHQTQEWVLNQWNVCFYLSSSPLLIKSQSQVEVERRDQINLLNLVFMKHFQSKRGIDLNREGELRAHETSYDPIERHSI